MCRNCDVADETCLKTVFVKKMQGNFCFIIKPSAGLGNASTGASPGLGGNLQSL